MVIAFILYVAGVVFYTYRLTTHMSLRTAEDRFEAGCMIALWPFLALGDAARLWDRWTS